MKRSDVDSKQMIQEREAGSTYAMQEWEAGRKQVTGKYESR